MRQTLPRMRSSSGVSEVIGTILILAMTVVLFASIIMWVSSIPTPQATIRLDMDAQLSPIYNPNTGAWMGANFTIQHRGGEQLLGFQTRVLFIVDKGAAGIKTVALQTKGKDGGLNYGIDGTNTNWDSGETWAYTNYSVAAADLVTLTVVNIPSSTVVFTEKVQAPAGAHPPVFIEKWLDGDTSTAITRDTPLTALPFGIYAKIEDPDGDLRSDNVSVKFTFGPRATYRMYDDATHGDRVTSDGIFTRVDPLILPQKNWDGGILILKAEDLKGHVTESRLIFQVLQNPNEATGEGGSGAKGPQDLPWRSEAQAFAIYNETAWDGGKWSAKETRTFKENEVVVVVVVSQYLRNLDLQNDLMFYDPDVVPQRPLVYSNPPYYSAPPYVRPVTTTSHPSTTHAFSWLEFTSDFFVYEYRFSTDSAVYGNDGVQLAFGQYYMEITLRANNVPPPRNEFQTVEAITVTPANGSATDNPVVEFFTSSAHTIKTTQFNFTDTMYVRVRVNNTDASVSTGDITLSDYIGGVQIWERARGPPSPISTIATNGTKYYKFSIDLSIPNRDPWIANQNAYGFRVKLLTDANEKYTLGAQVKIRGPRWSLDIVSAFDEFAHPVELEKWYSMFNDNDRLWTRYSVEKWKPSSSSPPWGGGTLYTTVLSDLDEDGDLDIAVGTANGYVWWYRNTDGAGHVWEKFTVDAAVGSQVRVIAAGQIDQDTDNDLVIGTSTGKVYWYANDGAWTRTQIVDLIVPIGGIRVADLDADGDRDVVVGTQDSAPANSDIIVYKSNGANPITWTATTIGNNVGFIVNDLTLGDYNNDTFVDVIAAFGSTVRAYRGQAFTGTASVSCGTSVCTAVDVGFVNANDLMDLAVGTDKGELFLWERISGSTSWSGSKITIIDLPDTTRMNSVRVGDVDGDLLDDVVVGLYSSAVPITGEVRLFRTRVGGTTWDNKLILSITGGASTPLNIRDIDIGDVDRGVVIDRSR